MKGVRGDEKGVKVFRSTGKCKGRRVDVHVCCSEEERGCLTDYVTIYFIMFSSSQELVVFLSSSSDNVDIVRKSWLDNVLYVPRKADLILHWLLTRLIGAYTPLFDIRYWSLLLSIACTHYQSIPPLLLRLPPLSRPIITFLDHVSPDEHLLINAFAESFSLLFPYASRRISLEALGDIICAILRFLSKSWVNLSEREGITKLFVTILLEYKTAFGVASVAIKKKVSISIFFW